MKIIAFYLPQFHEIPENNEWWGEGFTEWVNVKKAKPLFSGHHQPNVPLDHNYYNLLDPKVMRWQIGLAKEYGVYGFCFYHYWFDGILLLEKPVEAFLKDKSLDINFCLSWANENWTNSWRNSSEKILVKQRYGDEEDWKKHFDYLLPYLQDNRYIKVEGKPVLILYRPRLIKCLNEMTAYLDKLAKDSGLAGITFMSQNDYIDDKSAEQATSINYIIEYQPVRATTHINSAHLALLRKVVRKLRETITKYTNKDSFSTKLLQPKQYSYDTVWAHILKQKPSSHKNIPGAFVDWDNTPRKENNGYLFSGGTVDKFQYYLARQIENAKNNYHSDFLFLFAWNEWAEGGFVEPDEDRGYGRLEAIKNALIETGEFPE